LHASLGKRERVVVSLLSRFTDRRAARVGETDDFGNFIEGFAHGVVLGLAEKFIVTVVLEERELAMAPADNQGEHWELRLWFAQEIGVHVTFDVVNIVKWFVLDDGKRASGERANEKRTDQTWRVGDTYSVDVIPCDIGTGESFVDDREDNLNVAACGNLWYDTAEGLVDVDLTLNDITQQLTAIAHDCRGCFIAATLNS